MTHWVTLSYLVVPKDQGAIPYHSLIILSMTIKSDNRFSARHFDTEEQGRHSIAISTMHKQSPAPTHGVTTPTWQCMRYVLYLNLNREFLCTFYIWQLFQESAKWHSRCSNIKNWRLLQMPTHASISLDKILRIINRTHQAQSKNALPV